MPPPLSLNCPWKERIVNMSKSNEEVFARTPTSVSPDSFRKLAFPQIHIHTELKISFLAKTSRPLFCVLTIFSLHGQFSVNVERSH